MLDRRRPRPDRPGQARPSQAAASPIRRRRRRRPRQPPPPCGPPPLLHPGPHWLRSEASRSLAAQAAIREQQGRWCPSRARNHLTRNRGGGRRSHEEGGPAGRAFCSPPQPAPRPAQPRTLFLTALLTSLELRRPSQREMLFGHLEELIVLPEQLYSPKPTFIDVCKVLGHKTGTDRDPACFPPVFRRLIV